MSRGRWATISMQFDISIDEDGIWPDGAPDGWKATDVVSVVLAEDNLTRFLRNWSIDTDVTVTVTDGGDKATGMMPL